MSFFISDAMAQAAPAAQGDSIMSLLPLVIFFIAIYFFLIRPQSKRAKEHKKMVENLSKGDEISTNGGLLGKITEVGETAITVELAENVSVKVQKHAVGAVLPKGTLKGL